MTGNIKPFLQCELHLSMGLRLYMYWQIEMVTDILDVVKNAEVRESRDLYLMNVYGYTCWLEVPDRKITT